MIEIENNIYTETIKENSPAGYRVISKLNVTSSEEEVKFFNGVSLGPDNEFLFRYNFPDKSLYIVKEDGLLKADADFSIEALKGLLNSYNKKFAKALKQSFTLGVLGKEIKLEVELMTEKTEIGLFNLEVPKFQRLKDIIKDEDEEKLYSAFLNDELIFKELKNYCDYKKIKYDPEATGIIHLPLHKKLEEINEVFVAEILLTYLEQYFASQIYMASEKGSAEYELGLLMYLDRKFSSYMFDILKHCQEKNISDFTTDVNISKEFDRQLKQATKRVNKNPELTAIADKYTN